MRMGSSSSSSPPIRTGSWTREEDALLIALVGQHGPQRWSLISAGIPGRSGKSCRLRWNNQLSPHVHHRPFTAQEHAFLFAAHAHYGNKWATIARLFPGRTDNSVKNHWNSNLRRQQRRLAAAAAAASSSAVSMLAPLVPPAPKKCMFIDDNASNKDGPSSNGQCVISEGSGSGSLAMPNHDNPKMSLDLSLRLSLPMPMSMEAEASKALTSGIDDEKGDTLSNTEMMALMRQMVREEVQQKTGKLMYSLMAVASARANSVSSYRRFNGHQ